MDNLFGGDLNEKGSAVHTGDSASHSCNHPYRLSSIVQAGLMDLLVYLSALTLLAAVWLRDKERESK